MFSIRNVKPEVEQVIRKHEQVFTVGGAKDKIKHHQAEIAVMADSRPIFCKARPVPYAQLEAVSHELDRLESSGVITKITHSKWATPIVVVPKADESIRICGDYKQTVNKVVETNTYPLPTAGDLFATLAGGKLFSKIDLSNAYQQVELTERSKELLTINTHKGLFQYQRLPFGVSTAPAIFQCVMDQILSGMKGVVCYLDDILISSGGIEEHTKTLDEVMNRLKQYGVKAIRNKCSFMVDNVTYLRHIISSKGIHPTNEKIEAIAQARVPQNVDELRTFIGIIVYYCKFIPDMSKLCAPLYYLLREGVEWNWTKECQAAFQSIKSVPTSEQVLVHYDPKQPLILACDASPQGVGVVLSHIMKNRDEKPVAYASRTLTKTEQNYSQIEKEALAIIYGVTKFHKYLYGREFTLYTDHEALTIIFGSKKEVPTLAAARLQRWALILMAHQYNIKYRRSADHANADVLSRFPVTCKDNWASELPMNYFTYTDNLPVSAKEIRDETLKDPILSKVLNYTMNGWPNHDEDKNIQGFFF